MFGLFKKKVAQPSLTLSPEEQLLIERRNLLREEWSKLYHKRERDRYRYTSLSEDAFTKAAYELAWESFKRADEQYEALCQRLQERARTVLLRTSSDEAVSS